MNEIEQALATLEEVWQKVAEAHISMPIDVFEKRILVQEERTGVPFSGDWLEWAKQTLADPETPQRKRNMILMEADPPAMRPLVRKFTASLGSLFSLAPASTGYIKKFLADGSKDPSLRWYLKNQISSLSEALE